MSKLSDYIVVNPDRSVLIADQYLIKRNPPDGRTVTVTDRCPGDAHKHVMIFASVNDSTNYFEKMNAIRVRYKQRMAFAQLHRLTPNHPHSRQLALDFFAVADPVVAEWGFGVLNNDARFMWQEAEGLLNDRPNAVLDFAVRGSLLSVSRVAVDDGTAFVDPLPYAGLFGYRRGIDENNGNDNGGAGVN